MDSDFVPMMCICFSDQKLCVCVCVWGVDNDNAPIMCFSKNNKIDLKKNKTMKNMDNKNLDG